MVFYPKDELWYAFLKTYTMVFVRMILIASVFWYQRVHGARPVNSNSLAFLVTGKFKLSPSMLSSVVMLLILVFGLCISVLLLFMILNSHQMPPNFLV